MRNLTVMKITYFLPLSASKFGCLNSAWSITMASYATHAPVSTALGYTALFATGAFVMRGAGCTINDMWDRRLDRAVGMFLSSHKLVTMFELSTTSSLL